MNEGKNPSYFKWIFTRWYLYFIALGLLIINHPVGENLTGVDMFYYFIGDLISSFVIISFLVGIKKIFFRLFKKDK